MEEEENTKKSCVDDELSFFRDEVLPVSYSSVLTLISLLCQDYYDQSELSLEIFKILN